jgi:uncharacterized protein (TIGR01370 family)
MIQKSKYLDVLILDPDQDHPFEQLKSKTLLIAYISLGEAESYRDYWNLVASAPWLVGENPDWNENYYVDVRSPEWKKVIIDEVIPKIVKKGFSGLMLDTLDTAGYLESLDPEKYKGSKEKMIELVEAIHRTYPQLLILSNNGFDVLERLAPALDGLVVESLFWTHTSEGYRAVSTEDQEDKLGVLKKVLQLKTLPVFDIEYVEPTNSSAIDACIRQSRSKHFKPYIAQKNLDDFYPQPH